MIRYIAGVAAMEHSGKEVYVRDGDGDTARLFVGSCDVVLTPEELKELADQFAFAYERAKKRAPFKIETPKES